MQQALNFDLSEQPLSVLLRGDKWDSVWSELTDNVHIPEQSGHRFRHYPDSHSAINRTLILR